MADTDRRPPAIACSIEPPGSTAGDIPPRELVEATVTLRPGGMVWRRTFLGRLDQVPPARHFVRFLLADSPWRDDAESVVSELACNALRHTSSGQPHGSFIVEVVRKAATIRVTVYDCGWGGIPTFKRNSGSLDESGRGLLTVAALATKVGYRGTRAVGHAVWAQFDLGSS